MSDDKTKKRPQDASRVNIHQPYEVNWWCDKFNCTEAQLKAAVQAVGTSAKAVQAYLNK